MNILNPFILKALGSLLRAALMLAVPFFVSQGIWSPEEATAHLTAISLALATLMWSWYEKYRSQKTLVTALTMPAGSTQLDAETKAQTEPTPSVTLPKTEAPK